MAFRKEELSQTLYENESEQSSETKELMLNNEESLSDWRNYFDEKLTIPGESGALNGTINGYLTLPQPDGCLLVLQHGAGSSAMSFAPVTQELLSNSDNKVGFLALDLRAHGETTLEPESDMSLETLSKDFTHAVSYVQRMFELDEKIILVGHSLGGAICANCAFQKTIPNTSGLVVIDVVEGTAMEALGFMKTYLSNRPTSFKSIDDAISWHIKTLVTRNRLSACITVPSLLVQQEDGTFVWRTDLYKTSPYWMDWFKGLSDKFLRAPYGRMLIVAGTDRLDKTLTIGQMQGKYQLEILPETGHFVHEDVPAKISSLLLNFWHRNQPLVLPPKVGATPVLQ